MAKTAADYLTKGRRVAVIGRLRQNTWTTPEGRNRSKLQMVAGMVSSLDKPKTARDNGSDEPQGRPGGAAGDGPLPESTA